VNHKGLFALKAFYCVECTSYKTDSIKELIKSIDLLKCIDELETSLFCINGI